MSSSDEPERKKSRAEEGDAEDDVEQQPELPKGWEKRMSRTNSEHLMFMRKGCCWPK